MESMNRRSFLQKTAASLASGLLLRSAEAREQPVTAIESDLLPQDLERQKTEAASSLVETIPSDPRLRHVRAYAEHLTDESQMYIPQSSEVRAVLEKSREPLARFTRAIQRGQHGLFIFADHDSAGNNLQRLYVLKRAAENTLEFEKAYKVSTATAGFGNESNSGKTPLGIHHIANGARGLLGEVMAAAKHFDESSYVSVRYQGKVHWFVRGFGATPGTDNAEVVTDEYLLIGPHTDPSRGIRLHGTNRAGKLGANGMWQSFLGGRQRSGGCVRMSNTDIRDLYLSGYLKETVHDGKHAGSTPILIFATPAAMKGADLLTPEERVDMPARWTHSEHRTNERQKAHRTTPSLPPDAPPRWHRP
jgi:hypothetical protein